MTRKQVVHFTGAGPAWPASYVGFYSDSGATTPVTVYSDQIVSTVLASGKTGSSPVRKLRADNLGAVPPPALGIGLYVDSAVTTLYARPETVTGVAVSGAAAVSVASYGPDGPITPYDPSQQQNATFAPVRTFDVKTYGAKGDGTTVDTAAVQAAVAACIAAGGGTVFLPAGTYVVSNISLGSNVTLAGAGMGASILKHDPNPSVSPANTSGSGVTYDLPTLRINVTSSTQVNNVVMRDFTVDGNKTALHTLDATYRQYGIYIGGATGQPFPYDIHCTRVEVRNCKSYGFDIIRANRVTLSQCISHDNGVDDTSNNKSSGFEILGDDVTLLGCKSYNNRVGYSCGESGVVHYRVGLIGCTAQGNANEGVSFHDAMQDSAITGGAFRDNLSHGIALYGAVKAIAVTGVTATGNTGNGIRLDNCSNCTVTGNTCDSNSLGTSGNAEIRIASPSANNTVSSNTTICNGSNNKHIEESTGSGPNIVTANVRVGSGTSTNLGTGSQWFLNLPNTDSTVSVSGGTLTPTAVKTASYTAAAGDLVPVDTTSNVVTVTLPTAPADKTQVAVKHVIQGGANVVTVACGGSDVFNKASGATSFTLPMLAQGALLQYKASTAIWYVVADDLPLPQVDLRYAPIGVGTLVTKRVTAALSGTGNASGTLTTSGAGSDVCVRNLNVLPVTPTRYRFRIRNFNTKTNTAGGGPLTGTGIYVGTPTYPASGDGRWAGQFASAPTQVVASFTLDASANEYVSPWITSPAITERVPFATSIGLNNTGGGGTVQIWSDVVGGYSFIGVGASAGVGATGAPASLTAQKWSYFDTRLEYEYQTLVTADGNPMVPVGLFVGDSITQGICGQATLVPFPHESWVGAAALAHGFAAVNIGVSSAKTSDWLNTTSGYWTRVDLATTLPDFAAILIGINDVTTSATAATIQANILTTMGNLKTLGINRIYLGTIMPDGWGSAVSVTGATVTSGSKTVTVGSAFGLLPNMPITGTGIPASTTITSVDSATQVTISANGTATNSALTLTAGAAGVPTAAQEAVRVTVNEWIRSMPFGCTGVWDFDKALANPTLPGAADPAYISAYPHPDLGGYQRAAACVRL